MQDKKILAKGYARPIRENVKLSAEVKSLLLPQEMYTNAQPVGDQKAWEETTKQIPQMWQETGVNPCQIIV